MQLNKQVFCQKMLLLLDFLALAFNGLRLNKVGD
jgi:hypothetical protein